jgi:FKBP-type peptidyl-prolyl cis-trans isomerase
MKKPPAPAPARPASSGFWRILATVSLLTNGLLLIWVWRASTQPVIPPPVEVAATLPRELTPYAALGSFMAENNRIADLKWSKEQFAAFQDGLRASYEGRGLPMDDAAKRLGEEVSRQVQGMLTAERPDPMAEYFRTLREKENVKATASGLHYRITEEGADTAAGPADTVVISYTARLPDGQNIPKLSQVRVKVQVQDLLPGLAEGVQLLKVGGKALVYLPPELSFTEKNWPPQLPKGAPIVFFLELHDVVKTK